MSLADPNEHRGDRPAPRWWRRLLLVAIALLVPLVPFAVLGELPGENWVKSAAAGSVGPMGALVLASDVLLPIPSTIVGSFLGYQLGFWQGFFWSWLGLSAGSFIGWALGRASLSFLRVDFDQTPTALLLLATRPLPVLAEALLITAGASGVTLRQVALPIVVGNGAFALALAWSGAALNEPEFPVEWLAIPLGLPLIGLVLARRFPRRGSPG